MIEKWKPVKDFEGLYEVSNLGRVKSLNRKYASERILKFRKNRRGYCCVDLWKNCIRKTKTIHRLVTQTFIPNPHNKPHTNHLNGIKSDNRAINLEHCTCSENHIHAFKTGLRVGTNGIKNGHSKLTNKKVRIIKYALSFGVRGTASQLAKMINVSENTISKIKASITWGWIKI